MEKETIVSLSCWQKWGRFLAFLFLPLLFSGCGADSVPDEDFEMPTTNFPLLGNVPNPPDFDSSVTVTRQQNRLQEERDQAIQHHHDVIRSARP